MMEYMTYIGTLISLALMGEVQNPNICYILSSGIFSTVYTEACFFRAEGLFSRAFLYGYELIEIICQDRYNVKNFDER